MSAPHIPPERCAFSPYRLKWNPYVLETFQPYRPGAAAVNHLKSQVFHLISTAGGSSIQDTQLKLENSFALTVALSGALENALPHGMATYYGARRHGRR